MEEAGFVGIDRAGRIYGKITPHARKFEAWMYFHDKPKRICEARWSLANVPGLTPEKLARRFDITLEELMGETAP